ncbi:hypothetical protein GF312_00535 [Candidatus Poribacteria bacterium]|nr:hypothetical protein [Candidatus Poribacteria bacterium]
MKRLKENIKVFFILKAYGDKKGKRVLIEFNDTENCLYAGEKFSYLDKGIWNLTDKQIKEIESLLNA